MTVQDAQISTGDPAANYRAREQRVADVVALRQPDRVPISFNSQYWVARQAGMTCEDATYNPAAVADVFRQVVPEFQPDIYQIPFFQIGYGPALEAADPKAIIWPGNGGPPDVSYQYIDTEFMKADEYDEYLFDPTGYCLRKYLPRIARALAPLAKLPNYGVASSERVPLLGLHYADPEVQEAHARLVEMGDHMMTLAATAQRLADDLAALGFPSFPVGMTLSPFDQIADCMRGSKGALMDLRRRPDKLLAAVEKAKAFLIEGAIAGAEAHPGGHLFIPLHWGLDGFMSQEQFETFYWPQLREVILAIIDAGLVPYLFWEGRCDTRLETIADIPPGKAIYKFESTNIFRAKEILGDVVCLRGNVPASMLSTGTPEEIDAYCRKLIEVVGKDGGFILDGAVSIPDNARRENVEAMMAAGHKYGGYE